MPWTVTRPPVGACDIHLMLRTAVSTRPISPWNWPFAKRPAAFTWLTTYGRGGEPSTGCSRPTTPRLAHGVTSTATQGQLTVLLYEDAFVGRPLPGTRALTSLPAPIEYEADRTAADPDGLAPMSATRGRARTNGAQPTVARSNYVNNNLTPQNWAAPGLCVILARRWLRTEHRDERG